jgi:hypothetical protein
VKTSASVLAGESVSCASSMGGRRTTLLFTPAWAERSFQMSRTARKNLVYDPSKSWQWPSRCLCRSFFGASSRRSTPDRKHLLSDKLIWSWAEAVALPGDPDGLPYLLKRTGDFCPDRQHLQNMSLVWGHEDGRLPRPFAAYRLPVATRVGDVHAEGCKGVAAAGITMRARGDLRLRQFSARPGRGWPR